MLLFTVTLSFFRTEIEVVLRLNSSLFGSLIMFAIPGLMYIVYETTYLTNSQCNLEERGFIEEEDGSVVYASLWYCSVYWWLDLEYISLASQKNLTNCLFPLHVKKRREGGSNT